MRWLITPYFIDKKTAARRGIVRARGRERGEPIMSDVGAAVSVHVNTKSVRAI